MNRFEQLVVWQKAIDLAEMVYLQTANYPTDERYGLISQMRRSAVSVSSNIAEGAGRNGLTEFNQFLGIASGSSSELHSQAVLSLRLKLIKEDDAKKVRNLCLEINKMIFGLQESNKRKLSHK